MKEGVDGSAVLERLVAVQSRFRSLNWALA
jgi:hypothetical protein